MTVSGWIGVDLDGTLAKYNGWNNGAIGDPVPAMLDRVKKWVADGVEVKIFTARVGWGGGYSEESKSADTIAFSLQQRELIEVWLEKHVGKKLEITCVKDFRMIELWDDRAIQVVPNTGRRADGK